MSHEHVTKERASAVSALAWIVKMRTSFGGFGGDTVFFAHPTCIMRARLIATTTMPGEIKAEGLLTLFSPNRTLRQVQRR